MFWRTDPFLSRFRVAANPHVVFIDKRCLVKPDIVADSRYLPVRPGCADLIIDDPPHMIGAPSKMIHRPNQTAEYLNEYEHLMIRFPLKDGRPYHPSISRRTDRRSSHLANMLHRYGYFSSETAWINYLYHTARECRGALKPNGRLWYKIATSPYNKIQRHESVKRFHREIGFKLLSHLTAVSGSHQSNCVTHYLLMRLNGSADTEN